jgi:hypothetical protein
MFNVGDIITGTKPRNSGIPHYTITTNEAMMEVLEVGLEGMRVKLLSHSGGYQNLIEETFIVEARYFKLVRPHVFDNRRLAQYV